MTRATAATPACLLGMLLRMAYKAKKYHSGDGSAKWEAGDQRQESSENELEHRMKVHAGLLRDLVRANRCRTVPARHQSQVESSPR